MFILYSRIKGFPLITGGLSDNKSEVIIHRISRCYIPPVSVHDREYDVTARER